MTPLRLPEPQERPLKASPLSLVVCQVRHEPIPGVADARRMLDIRALLDDRYPKVEQRQGMSVTLGPGAPPISQEQTSGWQMKSEDDSWTVTLDPQWFAIETAAYVSWSDFRGRLSQLVNAVTQVHDPNLEVRLGLRMVDEVVHPDVKAASDWRGWIRDALLGPIASSEFGDATSAIQQIVDMDAGEGNRVILRHGTAALAPGKGWVYQLDHDCFRQSGRPLIPDDVVDGADALHRIALQVFQAAITDELYDYLDTGGTA